MFIEIIYLIYMYKKDLVLNNPQWSICHKNQTKPSQTNTCFCLHLFSGPSAMSIEERVNLQALEMFQ